VASIWLLRGNVGPVIAGNYGNETTTTFVPPHGHFARKIGIRLADWSGLVADRF
jgi:hypothetical protein